METARTADRELRRRRRPMRAASNMPHHGRYGELSLATIGLVLHFPYVRIYIYNIYNIYIYNIVTHRRPNDLFCLCSFSLLWSYCARVASANGEQTGKPIPMEVHCLCLPRFCFVQEKILHLLTFRCPWLRIQKWGRHRNHYHVRWNRHRRGSEVEGGGGRSVGRKGKGWGKRRGARPRLHTRTSRASSLRLRMFRYPTRRRCPQKPLK